MKYRIISGKTLGRDELTLYKGDERLAAATFEGGKVRTLLGDPDKRFTKRYGVTPAQEVLMHVAHHNKGKDGEATLRGFPVKDGFRFLAGLKRRGLIEERSQEEWLVKTITLHLPPVKLRK